MLWNINRFTKSFNKGWMLSGSLYLNERVIASHFSFWPKSKSRAAYCKDDFWLGPPPPGEAGTWTSLSCSSNAPPAPCSRLNPSITHIINFRAVLGIRLGSPPWSCLALIRSQWLCHLLGWLVWRRRNNNIIVLNPIIRLFLKSLQSLVGRI